jgi:hypothetical protein
VRRGIASSFLRLKVPAIGAIATERTNLSVHFHTGKFVREVIAQNRVSKQPMHTLRMFFPHNSHNHAMLGVSYAARKARQLFDEMNLLEYERASSASFYNMYATGWRLRLPDHPEHGRLWLSVQTSTDVAGDAFAETALLRADDAANDVKFLADDALGYGDQVERHREIDDLRQHIERLCQAITDAGTAQAPTAPAPVAHSDQALESIASEQGLNKQPVCPLEAETPAPSPFGI